MKVDGKIKLYEAERFRNLREMITSSVKKYKDKVAFVIKHKKDDKNFTYEEKTFEDLDSDIKGLATGLLDLGLEDKRIAIIAKNRYEWCTSYLAVVNGVGIVVPLDKSLTDEEIILSLKRSKADALIFERNYLHIMERIIKEEDTNIAKYICMDEIENKENILSYKKIVEDGKRSFDNGNKRYLEKEINPEEMRIILFTSGTTSISKAVMLSHKNIVENIYGLNSIVKIYDTDVNLAFLPMHHTFGCTGFLFFLSNGARSVFCDGIRHIQSNLKEYKVSVFVCVPLLLDMMYKKINQEVERQGKTKLLSIARKISNVLLKIGIDVRRKLFKMIIDNLGGNIRLVVSRSCCN